MSAQVSAYVPKYMVKPLLAETLTFIVMLLYVNVQVRDEMAFTAD